MGEVRTEPVAALCVEKKDFRKEGLGSVPGSFYLGERLDGGSQTFWYCCPCGCGATGAILVGENFKPQSERPSWNWNGSTEKPTLMPSVHHVGHWHGWLTDGVWRSC